MYLWLCFLALYLPFQLALNPGEGIDLASIRVLILAFFLVWLAKGLKTKKIILAHNLTTAFIVIFLFINCLSIFWAQNTDWSARKILFLLSIFPLYFIITSVIDNFSRAKKIIKLLIISGTFVSMLGILQFLGQFVWGLDRVYRLWAELIIWPFLGETFSAAVLTNPSWLVNISGSTYLRATATFPDPHMFSFFLGLLIPLALSLYLTEKNKLFLPALFLMIIADLLTFSRGGYLGLLAGLVFIVIYFWSSIGRKFKIAGAIVLVFVIIILSIPSPVSERFFSSFNLKEGSNQGRLETWTKALDVIDSHLLLGVGIGNYPLYIKPTADYREPIYAHDTYLDVAADAGLVSVFSWIGLLFFGFTGYLKRAQNSPFFLGGAVSLIIFSVHSLVETAIYSAIVLPLFLIIMAFSHFDYEKTAQN